MAEVGGILSVDEMLAKAKAAAATKGGSKNLSAVQKLLAGREESPTLNMSPVQRALYEQEQSKPKQQELYTEQDWFIKARVAQLKGQIQLYTNLPGLDPSGAIMEQLTKEVTTLVKKQADKIKELNAEAQKKQEELAKKQAAEYKGLSAEDMLKRTKALVAGTDLPLSSAEKAKSDAADALLKKIGAKVSASA